MDWKITKGIPIDKLCEEREFKGMCQWAKEEDPRAPFCIHQDCWYAYGYNCGMRHVRRLLNNDMK